MSLHSAAVIVDETSHHPIESGVIEKKRLRITSSIYKTLHCPVCIDIMYPPIHQCLDGHTLCSTCKDRVQNRCPICSQELGKVRCLALEQVAASFEFPCRYQGLGCHDILTYDNKLGHEKICDFRPYNCPAPTLCSVIGDAHSLVSHLKNEHSATVIEKQCFRQRYTRDSDLREIVMRCAWKITVLSCFDKHFCLYSEAFPLGEACVFMSFLQFMGSDAEAKNFKYSLSVNGGDRKLVWEGVPRGIRDSHEEVRDSQDGLMIPWHLAQSYFSVGDGKKLDLTVNGNIWKRR